MSARLRWNCASAASTSPPTEPSRSLTSARASREAVTCRRAVSCAAVRTSSAPTAVRSTGSSSWAEEAWIPLGVGHPGAVDADADGRPVGRDLPLAATVPEARAVPEVWEARGVSLVPAVAVTSGDALGR